MFFEVYDTDSPVGEVWPSLIFKGSVHVLFLFLLGFTRFSVRFVTNVSKSCRFILFLRNTQYILFVELRHISVYNDIESVLLRCAA